MRVLIGGGGTGGHLFPGVALAEALRQADPSCEVSFAGAERGLEAKVIPALGYPLVALPLAGVAGRNPLRALAGLWSLLAGTGRMAGEIRRLRPDLVVGLGGYASVPAVLAARFRGVRTVLLEQNVRPGGANRFLARFAARVYLGFPVEGEPFPAGRAEVTGNPLRRAALAPEEAAQAREERERPASLLVLGGSQGARGLNDLVLAALPPLLAERKRAGKAALAVVHQAGERDWERVREAYRAAGLAAETVPFIERMGEAYAAADLVVGRAGALTVSEVSAAGVPAVLVPYAHAGGHQRGNARHLAVRGGAVVLEQEAGPEALRRELARMLDDPARWRAMSRASREAGRRDAANAIAARELEVFREGR